MGHSDVGQNGVVMSTNWEYLRSMKMNVRVPSPNMAPITRVNEDGENDYIAPWFWPDNEMPEAVEVRQAAFLENQDRVLVTACDDPVVRDASQRLLWLQARYLTEKYPESYSIENSRKFGKVILNHVNEAKIDAFSLRPEKMDWHPLAISGMLGQEDICIVRRKKSGRQVLVAGFLATPTNWNLSNFLNADMDKIHKHVKGYHKPAWKGSKYKLKDTVDRFLAVQHEYPNGMTWRNNQFIEYIPTLAREPDDETAFDENEVKENPGEKIFLRSERETLVRLPEPYDDFTVFTIKPHVFRMDDIRRLRGDDFVRAVAANSVLRSALKSQKNDKQRFNFTALLENYLQQKPKASQ